MKYWILALILILAGCSAERVAAPVFHPLDNPETLSAWGMVTAQNEELKLGDGVLPFALNTPLFTDYAHKLRTVWMPGGKTAKYREGDVLEFPVGTVLSKTFYYPRGQDGAVLKQEDRQPVTEARGLNFSQNRLIETRLLVRREAGWEPLSYIWNAEQSEAKLTRIGAIINLELQDGDKKTTFSYVVPNINQCGGCHMPDNSARLITPIGPKPRHLNRDYNYAGGPMNQLDKLSSIGFLGSAPKAVPQSAVWDDPTQSLEARARAYLDVNCAHCHNPAGPADTSGLHLNPENQSQPHLGVCKNAVAAGGGTGGRKYDITPGDPDESIMIYRMETRDPGAMMPELGRSLAHKEVVDLMAEWIMAMEKSCG